MTDWTEMMERVADEQEAERNRKRGENFLKDLKGFCYNRGYKLEACRLVSLKTGMAFGTDKRRRI